MCLIKLINMSKMHRSDRNDEICGFTNLWFQIFGFTVNFKIKNK